MTVYYLQTNDQTEQLNQTIEQYLQCYLDYEQKNWVQLLLLTQFAYNSLKNITIGFTFFFANYERESEIEKVSLSIQHQSYEE